MAKKKRILTILWIIIAAIAIAAVVCYIVLPEWKGIFIAGSGALLILNLLFSIFFIHKNFKN